MTKTDHSNIAKTDIYANAEKEANIFNLKVLGVLIAFAVVSLILNLLNIFSVQTSVMFLSMLTTAALFLIPIGLYFIHDKWMKPKVLFIEKEWFRSLIITVLFIGIGFLCFSLSFHATLLMVIPPLMSAQYHYRKRVFHMVTVATLILVPVSIYGGFFFGAPDMNLLKGLDREQAKIFAERLMIATPTRMVELFTHYCLPMLFGIIIVIVLVSGTMRRNNKMLNRQTALITTIREDSAKEYKFQNTVIETLANMIETRDVNTGEHIIRTKTFVRLIAEAMQKDEKYRNILTDNIIDYIEKAAPLHDIGKIAVSDAILLKPAKLTPEEFDLMKKHTTAGWQLVERLFYNVTDKEFLKIAENIVLFHHEKWDGSGYPMGLKNDAIPLCARIMAVADVFDALVSKRVYKQPIPPEKAFEILFSESGTHFDPDVLRIVETIKDELLTTVVELEDPDTAEAN